MVEVLRLSLINLADVRDIPSIRAVVIFNGTCIFVQKPKVPYYWLYNQEEMTATEEKVGTQEGITDTSSVNANALRDAGITGTMSSFLFVLPANMMVYDLGEFETPKERKSDFCAREVNDIKHKLPDVEEPLTLHFNYGSFYFCVKPISAVRKIVKKKQSTISSLMSAFSCGTANF